MPPKSNKLPHRRLNAEKVRQAAVRVLKPKTGAGLFTPVAGSESKDSESEDFVPQAGEQVDVAPVVVEKDLPLSDPPPRYVESLRQLCTEEQDKHEQAISALKEQEEAQEEKHRKAMRALREELEQQRKRDVATIREELEQQKKMDAATIRELQGQAASDHTEAAWRAIKEEVDLLRKEKKRLEAEKQRLGPENQRLVTDCNSLEKAYTTAEEQVKKKKREIEELKAMLAANTELKDRFDMLTEQYPVLVQEKEGLVRKAQLLREENQRMAQELAILTEDRDDLKGQLEAAQKIKEKEITDNKQASQRIQNAIDNVLCLLVDELPGQRTTTPALQKALMGVYLARLHIGIATLPFCIDFLLKKRKIEETVFLGYARDISQEAIELLSLLESALQHMMKEALDPISQIMRKVTPLIGSLYAKYDQLDRRFPGCLSEFVDTDVLKYYPTYVLQALVSARSGGHPPSAPPFSAQPAPPPVAYCYKVPDPASYYQMGGMPTAPAAQSQSQSQSQLGGRRVVNQEFPFRRPDPTK